MGQKVNPIGFRTGIMVGWKSRWYASKKEFSELLIEDQKIRKFVKEKYKFAGIPKIEIERTRDEVKVVMHTARPGVIIGRKGQEVERLQAELQGLVGRRINIKIEEIARPEIQLSGRLAGSEMARCEKAGAGSIPLSTLRAKVDYGFHEAMTAQGHIGIKVWVNQGMYFEDQADGADAQEGQAQKKPKRTYKR